jgi:hypothetical protein
LETPGPGTYKLPSAFDKFKRLNTKTGVGMKKKKRYRRAASVED